MTKEKKPRRLRPQRRPEGFRELKRFPLMPPPEGASSIYGDVLLALLPLFAWSVYLYGLRPISIALISVIMTLGLDCAAKLLLKRGRAFDLSSAVTGAVIALCLPPSSPLWLPVFTAVIAAAVRHIFGGTGKNVINCAAASLISAHFIFSDIMSAIPLAGQQLDPFKMTLPSFKLAPMGEIPRVLSGFLPDTTVWEMLFGLRSGMIGEMSGLLILAGAVYLVSRRLLKPIAALTYIASVGAIAYLIPSLTAASDIIAFEGAMHHVLGANTMVCAVFMLSDPVTTPKTPLGAAIGGAIGGGVTMLLRYKLGLESAALISVIAVNLSSVVLNKVLTTMPFGGRLKSDSIPLEKETNETNNEKQE